MSLRKALVTRQELHKIFVPMNDPGFFMQILQCTGNLNNDMARKIFAEVSEANDLMEELASWTKLKDDEVILSGLGELDQLDNVGMIELTHNLNLFEDVFPLEVTSR